MKHVFVVSVSILPSALFPAPAFERGVFGGGACVLSDVLSDVREASAAACEPIKSACCCGVVKARGCLT